RREDLTQLGPALAPHDHLLPARVLAVGEPRELAEEAHLPVANDVAVHVDEGPNVVGQLGRGCLPTLPIRCPLIDLKLRVPDGFRLSRATASAALGSARPRRSTPDPRRTPSDGPARGGPRPCICASSRCGSTRPWRTAPTSMRRGSGRPGPRG